MIKDSLCSFISLSISYLSLHDLFYASILSGWVAYLGTHKAHQTKATYISNGSQQSVFVFHICVFYLHSSALWNDHGNIEYWVSSFQNIQTNLGDYERSRNDKHLFGLILFGSDLQLSPRLSGGQFKNGHPMIISQDWKGS